MTPELAWMIASSLISAAFAAGGAYGAVAWRFRALEGRTGAVERRCDQAHKRIDRILEEPRHANP